MDQTYLSDKSWMYCHPSERGKPFYRNGVLYFIAFAYLKLRRNLNHEIYCPCSKCMNYCLRKKEDVELHLVRFGFIDYYTTWVSHGEVETRAEATTGHVCETESDVQGNIEEEGGNLETQDIGEEGGQEWQDEEDDETDWRSEEEEDEGEGHSDADDVHSDDEEEVEEDLEDFAPVDDMEGLISAAGLYDDVSVTGQSLLNKYKADSKIPLYPNCQKFSKLSFFVRLFQIKCKNRWSNQSFSDLLSLLKQAFPEGNEVPPSWYEAQKIITKIGLKCAKIHACPNDCILYRNEYATLRKCPTCGAERYKPKKDYMSGDVPAKVLRHFPLIPTLQRLYMCEETAREMKWHGMAPRDEKKMSHPRDSLQWKTLDEKHPTFGAEMRNVRIGLASDGFSPFAMGSGGRPHSTWPVLITVYNLPPWRAMSQPYIIMALLIDGPSSPGKNIDVYLRPLIEELQTLWQTGVRTYDADTKDYFQMRAALMWTINDLPALGMLSGWITQGKLACPSCNIETSSVRLKCSSKQAFMGHRRFLPPYHRFRNMYAEFNGKKEKGRAPRLLTGADVLEQWRGYHQVKFGKTVPDDQNKCPKGWRKLSCFFDLPYWADLPLRHNIDFMHTEKGIGEHVVNMLLCKDGKTKDNLNARRDLADLDGISIRTELQPQPLLKRPGYYEIPHAIYNLNKDEKRMFLQVLKDLKVPDGFCSNIAKRVQIDSGKIVGLKSHDYHIIMQQLLPLCLRVSVDKKVGLVLNDLCTYFRMLCSKSIKLEEVEKLEKDIPVILSKLEMIFPPSFFDIIVHLCVHLATEVRIAGPVHYRWMYPIERYLFTLKSYIRNKYRPEGSMEQGYQLESLTNFCGRFLDIDVSTKVNKPHRVQDGPIGVPKMNTASWEDHRSLHAYVLSTSDTLLQHAEDHRNELKMRNPRWTDAQIAKEQRLTFADWCRAKLASVNDEEIRGLVAGPDTVVAYYNAYGVAGYKFETESVERVRATQNSGVATIDEEGIPYFGVLQHVIGVYYRHLAEPIYIFQCKWYDTRNDRGIKQDDYGLTLVNTKRTAYADDSYIYPSMATQIYYSVDLKKPDWSVVCRWKPRDYFNLPMEDAEVLEPVEDEDDDILLTELSPTLTNRARDDSNVPSDSSLVRQDLGQLIVTDQDLGNPQTHPSSNSERYESQKRAR